MNTNSSFNRNRCISYPRGQTKGDNQPAQQEANTPSQNHHLNQFQDTAIVNTVDGLEQTPPILNNRGTLQNGTSLSHDTANGILEEARARAENDAVSLHELIHSLKTRVCRNLKEKSLPDAIFFAEKAVALNVKRYEQSQTLTQSNLLLHLEAV